MRGDPTVDLENGRRRYGSDSRACVRSPTSKRPVAATAATLPSPPGDSYPAGRPVDQPTTPLSPPLPSHRAGKTRSPAAAAAADGRHTSGMPQVRTVKEGGLPYQEVRT